MKVLSVSISIFQKIIGIINIILIILIVLNIVNLALSKIQGNSYITFLDYTYRIVEEDNKYFNFKDGDFLLIDFKKTPMKEEIVLFNNDGNLELGKVLNFTDNNINIATEDNNYNVKQDQVVGTLISQISSLGNILNHLLAVNVLIISVVIIIITSIIQILLSKAQNRLKKPDFKKYNNPV